MRLILRFGLMLGRWVLWGKGEGVRDKGAEAKSGDVVSMFVAYRSTSIVGISITLVLRCRSAVSISLFRFLPTLPYIVCKIITQLIIKHGLYT
jgi:hypothetical protein